MSVPRQVAVARFARDPKEWPSNWYAYRGQDCSKDCLWDFDPLEHFAQQVRTVDPEATGKPFGTVEGLKAMKDGLQRPAFTPSS